MADKPTVAGIGLKGLILVLVSVMAFSIRLFSVVKYESVIHEFDPYFNYRVTTFLTKNGFYALWNWFDERTWYPLGRIIGGTLYPGLIFTSGALYNALHALNIPIHVQEVCVFTAPLFSAFCALSAYGLVGEAHSEGAGLLAAALVAVVPSYISRSVAGSYDNEGVAIFALVNVFFLFVRTLNTGSLAWATALLLSYFYMVLSWGGYSFIINLLPIYCLVCIASGRLTGRLYVAFSPLVIIGTLMAANIPVVGFNAILTSEHFGSFLATIVIHVALLLRWVRKLLPDKQFRKAVASAMAVGASLGAVLLVVVVGFVARHPTLGWTGRSLSLLDPTYASKYIPIIASVSEHQPPSWPSYITDLHVLVLLVPLGIMGCFRKFSDGSLFLVLYGATAVYFSGVMVRLMLVLAPAVCCLAAVGLSDALSYLSASLKHSLQDQDDSFSALSEEEAAAAPASDRRKDDSGRNKRKDGAHNKKKAAVAKPDGRTYPVPGGVAAAGLALIVACLGFYVAHCVYVSADMYSAPSVVLQSPRADGTNYVFDDFREAYGWLRHNTHPDAKVASWWDYGYQTTAMANRTVVVDNNTWNNTHIATVGRAMSSPEAKAWKIFKFLDVDYVFVVFGGLVGYPSDDINKFLWMVRIGGGVFPDIKEADYLTKTGEYKIDKDGSSTMLKSLMYKLSYLDFAKESELNIGKKGFDRVRNAVIGKTEVSLKYFEEVFTSQHWMMRIYKVRDRPNREKVARSGRSRKVAKS